MVHPVVRPDAAEAQRLVQLFNDVLHEDRYEIVERTRLGTRSIWATRRRSLDGTGPLPGVRHARSTFDAEYVLQQITRMEAAVEADPRLAIGTAEELVETTCKEILDLRGQPVEGHPDLPRLVRLVAEELDLIPEGVAPTSRAPDTIKRVLGSLAAVVGGVAELRNHYGTGHGESPRSGGLTARHAKLAVGAASTVAVFLFETHTARPAQQTQGADDS
jgi:hypothetical protein